MEGGPPRDRGDGTLGSSARVGGKQRRCDEGGVMGAGSSALAAAVAACTVGFSRAVRRTPVPSYAIT